MPDPGALAIELLFKAVEVYLLVFGQRVYQDIFWHLVFTPLAICLASDVEIDLLPVMAHRLRQGSNFAKLRNVMKIPGLLIFLLPH